MANNEEEQVKVELPEAPEASAALKGGTPCFDEFSHSLILV